MSILIISEFLKFKILLNRIDIISFCRTKINNCIWGNKNVVGYKQNFNNCIENQINVELLEV